MTLSALVYHRIGSGKYTNELTRLREHFIYIKNHFPSVLPGEKLTKRRLSVLLTFDDATFDFYYYVYPLLKELDLRVLLGVCPHYILPTTTIDPQVRLSVHYTVMMQEGVFERRAPFCTIEELKEMIQTGHVEVASHSYLHPNMTYSFVDLHREIVLSKECLMTQLGQSINSFIYPFGKVSGRVHSQVMQHYTYAFRVGNGYNFSWECKRSALMRIEGDQLRHPSAPFTLRQRGRYLLKALRHPSWRACLQSK